jgi:hypothetical protein
MEATLGQSGFEKIERDMEPVCFFGPFPRSESHRGGVNSSMSNKCDGGRVRATRLRCRG